MNLMRLRVVGLSLALIGTLLAPLYLTGVMAQDSDSPTLADELYLEINRGLIEEDAKPLARNEILDSVAETIAAELGASGQYQSVPPSLAASAGYPAWPDNSRRVLSEPLNLIGIQSPNAVAGFWTASIAGILANDQYREIGVATSAYVAVSGGTEQNVYVVVLAAQPNIIPVIINDGADTVYSQEVELYLHSELAVGYQTDEETIQRVTSVRIANSEDDLADADTLDWQANNQAVPWTLTDGFGEKSVWVEFEDSKGTTVRSEAVVEYADEAMKPTSTPDPADTPVMLNMTYGSDTFTLQISSEASSIDIQNLFFTWLDDLRTYQLSNADRLDNVNLTRFSTNQCIQVRVRGTGPAVDVPDCAAIYLEGNEFSDLGMAFWNPEFGSFKVYNGSNELGTCSNGSTRCELELR